MNYQQCITKIYQMAIFVLKPVIDGLFSSAESVLSLPRYAKRIIVLIVDIGLCIITVWLAFYLRLGEFIQLSGRALDATFLSILLAIPIFIISGLYRAIFRYSGWSATFAVLRAIAIYGLLYASIVTAIGIVGIPRTIGLIQPLLLFFAIVIVRSLARYWLGGLYRSQLKLAELPKTLVYGAGNAGRQLVTALDSSYEMRVIGFLDDDDRLHGHSLNGKPIFSSKDLLELIYTKKVTHVLLAIPSVSRRRRNEILKKLSQYSVSVRTIPSLSALAEGQVRISDIKELDIDDLLGRDPVTPNHLLLCKNITNKVVLVTGAGGSIGSELCRQIVHLKPKLMLLVDINEYGLYLIHMEIEKLCQNINQSNKPLIIPLLASVLDGKRMEIIMDTWDIDTFYHAAAFKHVPLVEHNPIEGIKNNVFGVYTVVKIAIEKGVSNFVFISTDKAVRPTNIMGASKRLAELCLQALYEFYNSNTETKISMVRFGNVLDSSGSVIPKFRQQIREGGPITLTHPDITRYFMTIPEASQLVIQAGAMAKGGDVFILDMGQPVKIFDLAKSMVELSGLSVRDQKNPEGDIEIQITGLRPGEKLYEELLLGTNPLVTQHPKILRAQDDFIPWQQLESKLNILMTALNHSNVEVVIALLRELVIDYQPTGDIVDWVFSKKTTTIKKVPVDV